MFFCIPRIMSGAHWVTDVLFAGMLAFFYVNTITATPLYSICVNFIAKHLPKLVRFIRNPVKLSKAAVAQQDRAQDS